jgi:two-component system response regulator HydG
VPVPHGAAPGRLGGAAVVALPPVETSLFRGRADQERALIGRTLERCGHNRSSAARALGVSRVTLHKKIRQYGLGGGPSGRAR